MPIIARVNTKATPDTTGIVDLKRASLSTYLSSDEHDSISLAIIRMVHFSNCWLVCNYNLHLVAETT